MGTSMRIASGVIKIEIKKIEFKRNEMHDF
jgi:hypothetical protein